MDVQLTDAQRMLSDTARDWLRQRWPEAAARQYFEDQSLSPSLWEELASLGWLGVGISEDGGGTGRNLSDVVTLQEQFGAALFPTLASSTLLVARLIDGATSDRDGMAELLARLTSGRTSATVAAQEMTGGFLTIPGGTKMRRQGDGWVLSGEKWFVRDAARASLFAVQACVDGESDPVWALVEASATGVQLSRQESAAHDGQHRVSFNSVVVPTHMVIVNAETAPLADAMVLEAARLAGIGSRAHAMAINHAKNRVQFGRPIGSFQAIQHKVADMTTDVESSLLATYFAAYSLDTGQNGFLQALVAKLWASEAIQRVVREAHQIHGGVGYITEHSLHLYYRNAATSALLFGSPYELTPAIAAQLLES